MFKRIFTLILVGASILFAANIAPSTTQKDQPSNVGSVINLMTSTSATNDTFATTVNKTFGPYEVCPNSESPMYKSFMVKADAITGTTPTMQIFYQMTTGLSVTDTASTWNLIDTIGDVGECFSVDISTKVGKGIMFRVYNYDGTTCIMPNKLQVIFKKDETYFKNK